MTRGRDEIAAGQPPVAPEAPSGSGRSHHLDNAKGILIVLVVLGHILTLGLTPREPAGSLYLLIYAFHMPAFAALAGYFARPDVGTPKGRGRFLRLLGALVLFQVLHALVGYVIQGTVDVPFALRYPAYTLWWLVCLAYWALLLPLFAGTRSTREAIVALGVAVAMAVVSGFAIDNGAKYTLSRAFVFLPFFLGGFYAARHGWRLPRSRWLTVAAVALFAIVGVLAIDLDFGRWQAWLQGKLTYEDLKIALWKAPLIRLGLLGGSAVMTVAFLQLVPRKKMWAMTALGSATLSVYLWHSLALTAIDQLKMGERIAGTWPGALGMAAVIVAATGTGPLAAVTMRFLGGRRRDRASVRQLVSAEEAGVESKAG